jgi:phage terminase Nu1 subunit (DNA packaging protein)
MSELLKQAELARRLGRDPSRIRELVARGVLVPAVGSGRAAKFEWASTLERYISHRVDTRAEKRAREIVAETLTSPDFEQWHARREAAQASIAELKLVRMREQLMTAAQFDKAFSDACGRLRGKLLNFAPRAAGAVLGASTLQEGQARIEPVVREIMEELRNTDDVPEPDDHESTEAPNDD